MSRADIAVVNPLGGALRHYTDALVVTLEQGARTVVRLDVDEPSVAGGSRAAWLGRYTRALRSAARSVGADGRIVITWPVIGYLDLLLVLLAVPRRVQVSLVVHDPDPLVRSAGHGALARALVRGAARHVRLVVHGAAALAAVTDHGLGPRTVLLPHPLLPSGIRQEARPTPVSSRPVVRVLGQYKADRDLDLLAELAPRLQADYRLEIHGRGWPRVPGWAVTDGFVTERGLDELIATSAVVLVPYRRFFQSGIAIRALELGVPFVGPRVEALEALVGVHTRLLVDDGGDWTAAIDAAVDVSRDDLSAHADAVARSTSAAWERSYRPLDVAA